MTQRGIKDVPADELWNEWRHDFEAIKKDIHYLFRERRTFREVTEVFRQNGRLHDVGGHLWDLMSRAWVSHVAIRVGHETDERGNTINLNQLLRQIEARPDVATRGRYFAMLDLSSDKEWLRPTLDESFTRMWLPVDSPSSTKSEDRVDVTRVAGDREVLRKAALRVSDLANQRVPHHRRLDVGSLTVPEVDGAFDAIERTLRKYNFLLEASSRDSAEPRPKFDAHEVFTFPWLPADSNAE